MYCSHQNQYRLLVASLDGLLHIFSVDPLHGGEAVLLKTHKWVVLYMLAVNMRWGKIDCVSSGSAISLTESDFRANATIGGFGCPLYIFFVLKWMRINNHAGQVLILNPLVDSLYQLYLSHSRKMYLVTFKIANRFIIKIFIIQNYKIILLFPSSFPAIIQN